MVFIGKLMIKDEQRLSLSPTYYFIEYKQMVFKHYLRENKTKEEIRKKCNINTKKNANLLLKHA